VKNKLKHTAVSRLVLLSTTVTDIIMPNPQQWISLTISDRRNRALTIITSTSVKFHIQGFSISKIFNQKILLAEMNTSAIAGKKKKNLFKDKRIPPVEYLIT